MLSIAQLFEALININILYYNKFVFNSGVVLLQIDQSQLDN